MVRLVVILELIKFFMSSCFSVDVSHVFVSPDEYKYCFYSANTQYLTARAHCPIIAGSGAYQDSTMHTGVGNINYVSYFVKRIQFSASYGYLTDSVTQHKTLPSYAVLFKIPYREPLLDDFFLNIKDFILYKEPECVLGFDIVSTKRKGVSSPNGSCNLFDITVTKPFIVGPNDYVGVFYMISSLATQKTKKLILQGTAKVWFDPV